MKVCDVNPFSGLLRIGEMNWSIFSDGYIFKDSTDLSSNYVNEFNSDFRRVILLSISEKYRSVKEFTESCFEIILKGH